MGMTVEEFINEKEMKAMKESIPDEAYVKVNDVLKIIDEVKESVINSNCFNITVIMNFLDMFSDKIVKEFYKNLEQ